MLTRNTELGRVVLADGVELHMQGEEELFWDCVCMYVHMWGCVHVLVCRHRALHVTGRCEVSVPRLLGIY